MKDFEAFFMDHSLRESDESSGDLKCLAHEICSIYIKSTQSTPRSVGSVQQGFYEMLCNLYYVFLLSNKSESWCVAYSRNKNYYRGRNPGYDITVKAIDWMLENGYCDHLKGFYDRASGVGRFSRLRYSETLRLTFEEIAKKVSVESRTDHLIRVKEAKSKTLYPDDESVNAVFSQNISGEASCLEKMARINAVRRQSKVTYRNQALPANDIYRVFNNDGFGAGGRFYGEFVQNQPKSVRTQILIDGEGVSELDYSGLHPRLLYDMNNLKMVDDPYTIPNFDRDIVKQAFQRVINNSSEGKAKNSIRRMLEHGGVFNKDDHQKILDGILRKHKSVISFGGEGICFGSRLQLVDSEIALEVMYHFAVKNIVCIGIHDSFIVKKNYEDELRRVMEDKYQEVVRREFVKCYERNSGTVCAPSIWNRMQFLPAIK